MWGLALDEDRSVDAGSMEMCGTHSMSSSDGFYFSMKHEAVGQQWVS